MNVNSCRKVRVARCEIIVSDAAMRRAAVTGRCCIETNRTTFARHSV